ncbi:hypothetical protein [Arenimonas fontis]|uniref:Polymer-forming cytoskeletal protein n=1 Tax=Arenimonas fontis TaxID=2608255 RepID=A0A5B2Z738_9GAMM|nr:hypothetical protein [Arenimonas fontis]KAA2284588.1 hypothetical protein F0415_07750 [Arenimonas fontis]
MRVRTLVPLVALSLALSAGPAPAKESISKVFGGITAEEGREYGSLDSVNGGITIRENAVVREAETVNGGISVGERARVGSASTVNGGISLDREAQAGNLSTVNGAIRLADGVQVEDEVETVNGGVKLMPGARIGGELSTVNGAISLRRAVVGGGIHSVNGDLTLEDGSVVRGGIRYEKPKGWNWSGSRDPRVVIGRDSEVVGEMVFEREVELFVHETARIGKVTGATAQRYSGDQPPR